MRRDHLRFLTVRHITETAIVLVVLAVLGSIAWEAGRRHALTTLPPYRLCAEMPTTSVVRCPPEHGRVVLALVGRSWVVAYYHRGEHRWYLQGLPGTDHLPIEDLPTDWQELQEVQG